MRLPNSNPAPPPSVSPPQTPPNSNPWFFHYWYLAKSSSRTTCAGPGSTTDLLSQNLWGGGGDLDSLYQRPLRMLLIPCSESPCTIYRPILWPDFGCWHENKCCRYKKCEKQCWHIIVGYQGTNTPLCVWTTYGLKFSKNDLQTLCSKPWLHFVITWEVWEILMSGSNPWRFCFHWFGWQEFFKLPLPSQVILSAGLR